MSDQSKSLDVLKDIGTAIVQSIDNEEFPTLKFPGRGTENLVYDEKSKRFVLGNTRVTRDSSNLRHIKSFTQLIWVASYAKQLLQAGRTSSLRDLYYSSEAFGVEFTDQAESDRTVNSTPKASLE